MIRKYVRREKGNCEYHIVPEDLAPDENNQFLKILSHPEDEWMIYDTWDVAMAIKLITLGYPIDLEELTESAKNMPFGSPGEDFINTMHEVYNRALRIAESSIAMEKIKDPDTPENWIAWARNKGYKIDHLDPSKRIHNLERARQKTKFGCFREFYQNQIDGWKELPNRCASLETETISDAVNKKNICSQQWQEIINAMAADLIKLGKKSQATKGKLARKLAEKTGENAATIERNTRKTW